MTQSASRRRRRWEAGTARWRFLKWQPHWHAAQKMKGRLCEGAAIKKKTVVALARQLAVDLWRWPRERVGHESAVAIQQVLSRGERTGRCTMDDLGWIPA